MPLPIAPVDQSVSVEESEIAGVGLDEERGESRVRRRQRTGQADVGGSAATHNGAADAGKELDRRIGQQPHSVCRGE